MPPPPEHESGPAIRYGPGMGHYGPGGGRQVSGKGAILLGAIFLLIGIGVLYFGVGEYMSGQASQSWPTVQGVIITSNYSSSYSCSNNKCNTYYAPYVFYTYTENGQSYRGNKVTPLDSSSTSFSYVSGLMAQYPVGMQVSVHYNPGDPSLAVLQPGATGDNIMLIIFGLVFAAVGAFVALKSARGGGQANPPPVTNPAGQSGT